MFKSKKKLYDELRKERENSAALRTALEAQETKFDDALAAEMIKRVNAETELAELKKKKK